MRRTIGLLVTLALSLLAAPLAAAQPQAALPRIGYLGDMPELFTDAFRQGVARAWLHRGSESCRGVPMGRVPGRPAPRPRRRPRPAQDGCPRHSGTPASRAAQHATRTISIVMAHVGDPMGMGLVTSLARPGGNSTGVSVIGIDTRGKRLELIKEAVPGISRVADLESRDAGTLIARDGGGGTGAGPHTPPGGGANS